MVLIFLVGLYSSSTLLNAENGLHFHRLVTDGINRFAQPGAVVADIDFKSGNVVDSGILYSLDWVESNYAMLEGMGNWHAEPLFTVGESLPTHGGSYTPPGILDGLGAFMVNPSTMRLYVNHELPHFTGYTYEVKGGEGGPFTMRGSRVSRFDIDLDSRTIISASLAYEGVMDAHGVRASDTSFLPTGYQGFGRFCSGTMLEPDAFGPGRGVEDRMYILGEEESFLFNPVGGAIWTIDVESNLIWHIPAMGRGSWENTVQVDTGTTTHVAFIISDDNPPSNADRDPDIEAAPVYLYLGEKSNEPDADFPARNGLRGGKLFVWVADSGARSPLVFRGHDNPGLPGAWVEVDNSPSGEPHGSGQTGYDRFGFPTQRTLWAMAEAVGAFQFSRPEDVVTDPLAPTRVAMASTGSATWFIDPETGDGVDTFGTVYLIDNDFSDLENPKATLGILYDGDADPDRAIRSPDNIEWSQDGFVYVQEDLGAYFTLASREPLFGQGATNPHEVGVIQLNPDSRATTRLANVNRRAVLDGSLDNPLKSHDFFWNSVGAWESSGIIDVSPFFKRPHGEVFLSTVQAGGLLNQHVVNPASRIHNSDLVKGGQLLILEKVNAPVTPINPFNLDPHTGKISLNQTIATHPGWLPYYSLFVTLSDGRFVTRQRIDLEYFHHIIPKLNLVLDPAPGFPSGFLSLNDHYGGTLTHPEHLSPFTLQSSSNLTEWHPVDLNLGSFHSNHFQFPLFLDSNRKFRFFRVITR